MSARLSRLEVPNRTELNIDISNLNLSHLERISNQHDIDNIKCELEEHLSPIYSIDDNQKIVAIGDIHGDLISLLVILFGSQLINNNLEWVGGNTFLVFTGDLLDDYRSSEGIDFMNQHPADEITIISYLSDLNNQAVRTEGRVLLCLGNHELINIIENRFVYVSETTKKYFRDFLSSREEQFRPNSILRRKLSCLFEPFILVNNKYFFCHAGLTPKFIEDINIHYQKGMMENLLEFSKDIKNIIISGCDASNEWIMEHMVRSHEGAFFWTRYYRSLNKGCNVFDNVSKLLGLNDLILIKGHDTQDNNIVESCNKKIYIIDTTISRSFLDKTKTNKEKLISDHMNYLEIQNNIFSMIRVRLTNSEKIYREKIEQFIYNETNPLPQLDLEKMKVTELRDMCKKKGVSSSGTKLELVRRLSDLSSFSDNSEDIKTISVSNEGDN